jgi:hypothetical protein
MFNTQGCSKETCSHVWVRQLHQIHGDVVVPAAAQEFFVEGIHWLVRQREAFLSVSVPLSRTVLEWV